jgi:membrane protein DedA with SNARE-associated domain
MELFHQILDLFSHLEPIHYILLVFLGYLIENVFPPLPGDTMLVFSAYVFGLYFTPTDIYWLYVISVLGAIVGFMIMYVIGRRFDRDFFLQKNYRFANSEFMLKSEALMSDYGGLVVLGNRIFLGMRPMIGLVSGMTRMKWYLTLIYVTISSLVFNAAFLALGYLLGENWAVVERVLGRYFWFTLACLLALVGLFLFRKKKKNISHKVTK